MNISYLATRALLFTGMAMLAGCSVDVMPDGADDTLELVDEAEQAVMGDALMYGHEYLIQNQYVSSSSVWQAINKGGYLDTRQAGCEGNNLCVSTASSATRDGGTGTWMIMSASGKPNGSPVASGDLVYMRNMYAGNGGFLDVRGAGCEGNKLCVSTANGPMRDSGSGTWKIQTASGSGTVTEGQDVHFLNGYAGFTGGYLDTRASGCEGNQLCVSTSATWDRDGGSTRWKLGAAASPSSATSTTMGNFFRAQAAGSGSANRPAASYGRSAGTVPTTCDPGWEFMGGFCYSPCPAGYYGVGIACWQSCPSGYTDTGALCQPSTMANSCPWYNKCGVDSNCDQCPSGWTNMGCSCQHNGSIFAKSTSTRSMTLPHCSGDKDKDAGLCYKSCDDGYEGVGPVCWLGSIGSGACQRLYDPSLANAAISGGAPMMYGVGAGVEVIASGGVETGVVYGSNGEYGCYTQWCAGIASNISASVWASFGVVNGSFDDAAGPSYVASGSAGLGWVGYTEAYSINPDGSYGGSTAQLSLGKGVLPVSIAGAYCDTSVTRLW